NFATYGDRPPRLVKQELKRGREQRAGAEGYPVLPRRQRCSHIIRLVLRVSAGAELNSYTNELDLEDVAAPSILEAVVLNGLEGIHALVQCDIPELVALSNVVAEQPQVATPFTVGGCLNPEDLRARVVDHQVVDGRAEVLEGYLVGLVPE